MRFKNRVFAAKILAGALEDSLKKRKVDKKNDTLLKLGIPRVGVIVAASVLPQKYGKSDMDVADPYFWNLCLNHWIL